MDQEPEPMQTALLPALTKGELGEVMAALQERIATLTVVVNATTVRHPSHAKTQDARTICQSVLVAVSEALLSIDLHASPPSVLSNDHPPLLMGDPDD